ncbi:hypothetical protein [Burkholderia plantarii]|nr:hypothetical protein [Burkholderia plantarii]
MLIITSTVATRRARTARPLAGFARYPYREPGGAMTDFIDTRLWPIVQLHMPAQVDDASADERLAQFQAVHTRGERFVFLLDGEELPRHSPRFMSAYTQWTHEHVELLRNCAGAIRIEPDPRQRGVHEEKARIWNASDQAPYPFLVAASREDALARARALLSAASDAAAGPRTEPNP